MDMDNQHRRLSDSNLHKLELENEIIFSAIKQSADIPESYNSALSIAKPPNHALSMDSDRVIKYLNHILLEDDIDDENNHDSFCDPVALRAAESSLYEAMHDKHSSHFETSVGSLKYGDDCTDLHPRKSFVACDSSDLSIQPSSCQTDSDGLNPYLYDINSALISRMDAYLSSADSIPNNFCDVGDETIMQFKRGVEEASNFLPAGGRLVINFDNYPLPPEAEELTRGVVVNIEKEHTADSRRGRKHYYSNENVLEERSRKHPAVHNEDAVKLSEVFDKVFLCTDDDDDSPCGVSRTQQQRGRSGPKSYSKKQGQVVDLSALLTRCAKYVAVGDYRAAVDELKKIRKHSSPTGDASQRLGHAFADALEARLTGCGTQLYVPSFRNTISVSGLIKSHMSSSLPFMRLIYLFSNQMIYEAASRGSSLHVIDFGILHGIQWPTLIRDLSQRPGGPPRLRITGIELPQPGFRPSQMVVDTGLRLTKFCKRFGVPFEYNAITTQHWEAIKIDELKLASGEVVAVNCVVRFKHLLDEAAFGEPSPRDAVLNLIQEVNPHIFVHTVHSASHSSPLFLTRFREALYLYSAFYDSFDALFPRDDNQRLDFEQEYMVREIRNIIACEGIERIERPETYKQWQSRSMRAGLEPVPLNPQVVGKLIGKARTSYHKDFLFAEDGHWVLQGMKGRIVSASSCWVAAKSVNNKHL